VDFVVGLLAQDAWTIGGLLTLHLGLRTENEHVASLLGDVGTLDAPQNEVYTVGNPGYGWAAALRLGVKLGF
jgi:hypothetical protein